MNDYSGHTALEQHCENAPACAVGGNHRVCSFAQLGSTTRVYCGSCVHIAKTQIKTAKKRHIVVNEGAVRDSSFLVLEGVLKLSVSLRDGRTQIVGIRFPGEIVTTRLFGEPWFATVEVVKDAKLRILSKTLVETLLSTNTDFGEMWNAQSNLELSVAQEHLVTLGQKVPLERLAGFLLELNKRSSHANSTNQELLIPISRDDIGAYLGLESETVSRQFTRLKDIGLIEMNSPCRVLVRNWRALECLCEGERSIAAE